MTKSSDFLYYLSLAKKLQIIDSVSVDQRLSKNKMESVANVLGGIGSEKGNFTGIEPHPLHPDFRLQHHKTASHRVRM